MSNQAPIIITNHAGWQRLNAIEPIPIEIDQQPLWRGMIVDATCQSDRQVDARTKEEQVKGRVVYGVGSVGIYRRGEA